MSTICPKCGKEKKLIGPRCECGEPDGPCELARASGSAKLRDLFPKLSKPRKQQQCRLCGEAINVGEECCRWSGIVSGEGFFTSHAHPECYDSTLTHNWDEGDWECCQPGDMQRPNMEVSHGHKNNPEPR